MTEQINAKIPKSFVEKVQAQDPNKSKNFAIDMMTGAWKEKLAEKTKASNASVSNPTGNSYRNPDGSFISIGSIGPGTILFGLTIWYFFFRK